MSTYVPWKDLYSVGEDTLDAQHRQILALINDLYDARNAGREYADLAALLDRMVLYTMSHFQHESR